MKIRAAHFEMMRVAISDAMQELGETKLKAHLDALLAQYPEDQAIRIYRWNILFAVPSAKRTEIIDLIYAYANDDHIDTALRKIMKEPTP